MEQRLKESVGVLMAHIIKIDNRDIEKEMPIFCDIMGTNFNCSQEEAEEILHKTINKEYNLDEYLDTINVALCEDKISKFHLLEQLNHVIYSDTISPNDYKVFDEIKEKLFTCK
ncbi:MAG: hypothetical protein GQ531_04410 [Sulfurovum sp.]|nr:hypothetical protein [Sulfurovum sp.]